MNETCLIAGEILWDCFPEGECLGGATLNVAYHLMHCGTRPLIASSVGRDRWGEEALRVIRHAWGCDPRAIRVLDDGTPTGRVTVTVDEKGDGSYDILDPAGWDFISLEPDVLGDISSVVAFVYPSVGLRHDFNRGQIGRFLDRFEGFACFDANIRPPHNSVDLVRAYAAKADFVKMNEQELALLLGDGRGGDLEDRVRRLAAELRVECLCVTRAEQPAAMLYRNTIHYGPTCAVEVVDTVGAGDAFFGSMIHALLGEAFDPVTALADATRLGSWVASRKGAQPAYDP